jgi:hypothetical protein
MRRQTTGWCQQRRAFPHCSVVSHRLGSTLDAACCAYSRRLRPGHLIISALEPSRCCSAQLTRTPLRPPSRSLVLRTFRSPPCPSVPLAVLRRDPRPHGRRSRVHRAAAAAAAAVRRGPARPVPVHVERVCEPSVAVAAVAARAGVAAAVRPAPTPPR